MTAVLSSVNSVLSAPPSLFSIRSPAKCDASKYQRTPSIVSEISSSSEVTDGLVTPDESASDVASSGMAISDYGSMHSKNTSSYGTPQNDLAVKTHSEIKRYLEYPSTPTRQVVPQFESRPMSPMSPLSMEDGTEDSKYVSDNKFSSESAGEKDDDADEDDLDNVEFMDGEKEDEETTFTTERGPNQREPFDETHLTMYDPHAKCGSTPVRVIKPWVPPNSIDLERFESKSRDPKSVGDYLKVMSIIATIPVAFTKDQITNTFAGKDMRRDFIGTAMDSVMGHCYKSSTLRQLRVMTGRRPMKTELGSPLYFLMTHSWGLPHFNHKFSGEGFVARWISEIPDRRPEDPVMVYFHGGGFALKIAYPQVKYICGLAKRLVKRRVSVLALDYTITPFARYPAQRNQALACFAELQKSCDNIMLFGDSCGGNLVLSLLLEENNPAVVDHSKIHSCVLISPWVDPADDCGSMMARGDILSMKRLQEMTASFAAKEELQDPRVSPIKAEPEVWQRVLPARTCMVWGERECLADQDARFMHVAGIDDVFIEKNGTHDCILRGLSPEPSKYVTLTIDKWLACDKAKLPRPQKRSPMMSPSKSPTAPQKKATKMSTPPRQPSAAEAKH